MAHNKVQVISFLPGLIFNEYWQSMGVDVEHFDDGKFLYSLVLNVLRLTKIIPELLLICCALDRLTGSFAVWAASNGAAFLHGRTVWCSWDVDEMASGELRERLDKDFHFLRGTIAGLNGGNLA